MVMRAVAGEVGRADVCAGATLADVTPAGVIPADVIPADVIPADVIPADVIPAGVIPVGAPCACALCPRAVSLAVDTIENTASVSHTINVIRVASTDIVDIAVDA